MPSKRPRHLAEWLTLLGAGLSLQGCGSDVGGGATLETSRPVQTYALSASISGLTGTGLTLKVNGTEVTVADGVSTVPLMSGLSSGTSYTVTVASQPGGETCSVAGGSGVIGSANVSNVVLTCAAQAFSLGGTIAGLNGSGLVLANGGDTLAVAAGAAQFTMPSQVAFGSSFAVTVKVQPPGLACAVSHGTGTMPTTSVNDVTISCADQPFALGGTISGLGANSGLVLSNGPVTLTVAANASQFTMPAAVPFGTAYAVQVQSSPPGLTCSVANGLGTMGASDVTNIAVSCADRAFTVGGTITGLATSGLVLANGSDTLSVPSGASAFTMTDPVAYTGTYGISVQTNPTGATCTVAHGSGTMGTAAVSNVTVTCALMTETIAGTILGLGANGGLVVLNNGADATPINANATSFTLQSGVAYGASYDITVGTQPYGIALACTVSGGAGVATSDIHSVVIDCASVTSHSQTEIAGYFSYPVGVAVDGNDDVFVADADADHIIEFTFSNGNYSLQPVKLLSGLIEPQGVSLDAGGNLFIADSAGGDVLKVIYSNGSFSSTALTVASGFGFVVGIGEDSGGNVFVSDNYNSVVEEIPYDNGSYGAPIALGSGFSGPAGLALDASGNVFVADNNHSWIDEIVKTGGAYGSGTLHVGSGFNVPTDVAFDAGGNLFIADTHNNAIEELAYGGGAYGGSPVAIGSGFDNPQGLVVDTSENVFVADSLNRVVRKISYGNGAYSPTTSLVGSGLGVAEGLAVDASGNVFVADQFNAAVMEIVRSNGRYLAPVLTLASGINNPNGLAVDSSGDLFVAGNAGVEEIKYSNGSYDPTPLSLGSGFSDPQGVAVDARGDVFVADAGLGAIEEIVYSNGSYGPTPVSIATGLSGVGAVAVDAAGNVFAAFTPLWYNQQAYGIEEFVYSNGSYSSSPLTIATVSPILIQSMAIDAAGNLFLADQFSGAVDEIVYSNGNYAATPITVSSALSGTPRYIAVDAQGRVYVDDSNDLIMLGP